MKRTPLKRTKGLNPRSKTNSKRRKYRAYLQSSSWKALRQRVLIRDGFECLCGAPATEVHHLSYERFGSERLEDLVSICKECHSQS